ncbi:MAG: 3-methyl-2-oxobutanoate dehydrogenase subunit VorB [Spirochaetales bacterium]|nr:3-methyl-2-oxobutanoate dehydrogenase subunit VorB [Spirochaetales bacterium]
MARYFLKGNEAVVVGALVAGCESFYGYPITPASEIAHAASEYFPTLGRTFLQAESELASINMVYGAASTGQRTMTASSSPGISLMCEGISYMAGCELPCLVVDIMRAGPGLGNIGAEQSDYNQLTKGGGHGDYLTIVLAPNSVQEMIDFAILGFDLADKYRNPVVIAADGVIGQMMESVSFPEDYTPLYQDKPWALTGDKNSERRLHTSIYIENDELEAHNMRLQEKFSRMKAAEQRAEEYMTEDAELLLVGYGSVSRQLKAVVNNVRQRGVKAGLFRPVTISPFPAVRLEKCIRGKKRIVVAEMSSGQLHYDVKALVGNDIPISLIGKLGGNLIEEESILREVL